MTKVIVTPKKKQRVLVKKKVPFKRVKKYYA